MLAKIERNAMAVAGSQHFENKEVKKHLGSKCEKGRCKNCRCFVGCCWK